MTTYTNKNANGTQIQEGNQVSGRWFDGARKIATGECIKVHKDKYHIKLSVKYTDKFDVGDTMKLFQVNCWNLTKNETSPPDGEWEAVGRWRPKPSGKKRGSNAKKFKDPHSPELLPTGKAATTANDVGSGLQFAIQMGYITEEEAQEKWTELIYLPQAIKSGEDDFLAEILANYRANKEKEEAIFKKHLLLARKSNKLQSKLRSGKNDFKST